MDSTVITEGDVDDSEEAENEDIPFIEVSDDGSPERGNNSKRGQNDASDKTERGQNDPDQKDESPKNGRTRLGKLRSFTKNNNNTSSSLGDTTVVVVTDAADALTWRDYLKTMGPGILVCLADTD